VKTSSFWEWELFVGFLEASREAVGSASRQSSCVSASQEASCLPARQHRNSTSLSIKRSSTRVPFHLFNLFVSTPSKLFISTSSCRFSTHLKLFASMFRIQAVCQHVTAVSQQQAVSQYVFPLTI